MHMTGRMEGGIPALDIEELLHADVSSESCLSNDETLRTHELESETIGKDGALEIEDFFTEYE